MHAFSIPESSRPFLIRKVNTLLLRDINPSSPEAALLLLILLLCEALAPCDNQILVRTLAVRNRHILIGSEFLLDLDVLGDAAEGDVLLLTVLIGDGIWGQGGLIGADGC